MDIKLCKKCEESKPLTDFSKNKKNKDGLQSLCKPCYNAKARQYWEDHPELHEITSAYNKKYRKDKIDRVFEHYGNKCACCGETEPLFLTLDHVNNDGAEHRRELNHGRNRTGNTDRIYRYIIDNDFPDSFQILCYNCNSGKHRNGGTRCPHEKEGN